MRVLHQKIFQRDSLNSEIATERRLLTFWSRYVKKEVQLRVVVTKLICQV